MNCKIYGGICGVGGFCEDCPHKDHSEDVLDMVEEKPLDRGKVSQWITFHRRELYDGTIIIDPDELRDAINSGRLDVEEG
jgi:hypothetical protein